MASIPRLFDFLEPLYCDGSKSWSRSGRVAISQGVVHFFDEKSDLRCLIQRLR